MLALQIKDICSGYHHQPILKNLNLAVENGEIMALLGPSGCGKSTLLRAIAGLQPCSSGSISIQEKIVNGDGVFIPSEQRGVGMIFQDYALFPHMTIAENILFGVKKTSNTTKNKTLNDMLALVHLEGLEGRYPHELSGGQQQRVSIARALAYEPKLLLLDEPFSNIDPQVRQGLMLQMRVILKSRNITAIFVTHSKDEAFVFADKLALFQDGYIAQSDTSEALYSTPCSRYVADFLGGGNYLPIEVRSNNQVATPFGMLESTSNLSYSNGYCGEILLRPHQFNLSVNENGRGTILERHFLGHICHYRVQVQSYLLDVKSPFTQLFSGQKVDIYADAHDLVIF